MARNAQLNLRVKPALKAELERLAKEDRRTLSAYVEKLLEDHVEGASQVSVKEQKQKARGIFERLIKKQAK
jgi:hypothetical protein